MSSAPRTEIDELRKTVHRLEGELTALRDQVTSVGYQFLTALGEEGRDRKADSRKTSELESRLDGIEKSRWRWAGGVVFGYLILIGAFFGGWHFIVDRAVTKAEVAAKNAYESVVAERRSAMQTEVETIVSTHVTTGMAKAKSSIDTEIKTQLESAQKAIETKTTVVIRDAELRIEAQITDSLKEARTRISTQVEKAKDNAGSEVLDHVKLMVPLEVKRAIRLHLDEESGRAEGRTIRGELAFMLEQAEKHCDQIRLHRDAAKGLEGELTSQARVLEHLDFDGDSIRINKPLLIDGDITVSGKVNSSPGQ